LVFLSLIGFPLIGVILYSYPIGFVLSSKKFYFVLKPTFALSFGGASCGGGSAVAPKSCAIACIDGSCGG